MRKVLTLLIALILSMVCANGVAGQGEGKRQLLPVVLKGKWGFIDRTGKIVVAPQFDEADKFADGLAHVRVANKHGFIDRSGRYVFPLEFDDVSPFFDGIAKVGLEDYRPRSSERQKIGYIDSKGNYIWKPTD